MNTQDEELLFKDLCSRLAYGVIVNNNGNQGKLLSIEANPYIGKIVNLIILSDSRTADYISNIKPYLRPMSSMTKEEYEDLSNFSELDCGHDLVKTNLFETEGVWSGYFFLSSLIDWLYAHHFDFCNLIERGLAIDCTGLNIY